MTVYYNDIELFTNRWLRELVSAGELGFGIIDERSITEILSAQLQGFTRVHLFAGIGGWEYALRLAGWPDDREVWTGSCPCQPFSCAGKQKGAADARHLWPEMRRLIADNMPSVVFGEQVASKAGREWLAGVQADLEALGYEFGAADLCAAGVGAPHIRQRLWWVADASPVRPRPQSFAGSACEGEGAGREFQFGGQRAFGRLGDIAALRRKGSDGSSVEQPGAWAGCTAIYGRDGKWRRISSQPGDEPLAYGLPRSVGPALSELGTVGLRAAKANRTGRLKGYGNAIVPQLAATFIRAYMEARGLA